MELFDPYHKWLAIPPDQRPPTHYQLLGISPTETDADVIDEAVMQRTAHLRAYQIGPHAKDCTRLLNEIAQAKVVLLNPAKRSDYDAQLARSAKPAPTSQRRWLMIGIGLAACVILAIGIPILMNGNRAGLNNHNLPEKDKAADGNNSKPPERRDVVWIDDELPEGAQFTKLTKKWEWGDASVHQVLSGTHSVKASGAGHHARFFHGAATFLAIHAGDTLFAYVWLDPKDPPEAIMLQFHDGNRWDHRAYWGEDLCIAKGEPDAPFHRRVGPLPSLGQWTRLEVRAEAVGFVPDTKINGLGLNQFGGTVYFDKMGVSTAAPDTGVVEDVTPHATKGKKKK